MQESQIYNLLNNYNIATPAFNSFKRDEVLAFAHFPAVLKIESPKVVHKSDVGGVVVGIQNSDELQSAKEQIIANLKAHNIELDSDDRFLVSQMVKGEELYIGAVDDAIFGNVIVSGKGGIFLELFKDITYIDTLASRNEIAKALNETKISKLFKNFRGFRFNIEQWVDTVVAVQNLLKSESISELDINPLIINSEGIYAVDARITFATPKERVEPKERSTLFAMRNIAIVGVSADEKKVGYAIAQNALGSSANLFFVNPKGGTLLDQLITSSIDELEDIDTAVIVVPPKFVLETIKSFIPKGLKNVIIISAGFKESGGADAERVISDLANAHNLNIIGPNCLGVVDTSKNLNLSFGAEYVDSGKIALLSQSGAILAAIMDKAHKKSIGFSKIVSLGNMSDIEFADLVKMLNEDEKTEYITMYIEGLTKGAELLEAIRASKKQVYFFKAGKSQKAKKAAMSHTGNLAGDYEMFEALLRLAGAKVLQSAEGLYLAPLFDKQNILVVTNAGGIGTILSDKIEESGKNLIDLRTEDIAKFDTVLPATWSKNNPVDIIGDARSDRFARTLEVASTMENVDLIYVCISPQFMTDSIEIAKVLTKDWGKPIIPLFMGGSHFKEAKQILRDQRKIVFDTIDDATAFI